MADVDLAKAREFCRQLADPRLSVEAVDVNNAEELRGLFGRVDFILNCTSNRFGVQVVEAAIAARRSMLDLGGLANTPKQLALDGAAREAGVTVVLGCGATLGVSNIMARRAAEQMDVLEEVHISFASFRAIALAPGVVHTMLTEFSSATKRFYYQDGEFVEMPPFAGAKTIAFPPPVGMLETYYVPHSETFTLPRFFGTGLRQVTVRGSWRPEIMAALRFIQPVQALRACPRLPARPPAGPHRAGRRRRIRLLRPGRMSGNRGEQRITATYDLTHPPRSEWRHTCTAKVTGIPASIGAQLLLAGRGARTGVMGCLECFAPEEFFADLVKRQILVHERVVAERTYREAAAGIPA